MRIDDRTPIRYQHGYLTRMLYAFKEAINHEQKPVIQAFGLRVDALLDSPIEHNGQLRLAPFRQTKHARSEYAEVLIWLQENKSEFPARLGLAGIYLDWQTLLVKLSSGVSARDAFKGIRPAGAIGRTITHDNALALLGLVWMAAYGGSLREYVNSLQAALDENEDPTIPDEHMLSVQQGDYLRGAQSPNDRRSRVESLGGLMLEECNSEEYKGWYYWVSYRKTNHYDYWVGCEAPVDSVAQIVRIKKKNRK